MNSPKFILQIHGIKEYHGSKILKSKERVELTDKILRSRDRYPVRNYTDMRNTINSLQQQFLTNSLFTCSHILVSEDEGMELYTTWNKGWAKMSEDEQNAKNAKLQSSTILEETLRRVFSKDNPALQIQLSRCSFSHYKHRGVLHLMNDTASFRGRLQT